MNLFRRKEPTEPAPAPAPASPLEVAALAVEAADRRIAAVNKEFLALAECYQVRVDRNGCIASAILPDHTKRDEIETIVRANLRARDAALSEFYKCLNIWSGLKGNNQ